MLFLYRTAMDNEYIPDQDRQSRAAIYFYDEKTHERFSATCLTITRKKELENEQTPNGNPLFESSSEWLIELSNGKSYTRKLEHRIETHIHYPEGWDDGCAISNPVSLFAMNCSKGGSIRVGVQADSWIQVERGDML